MSAFRIVGIAGNITRPSRTRTLVDAVLAEVRRCRLGETQAFDIVDAGPELGMAVTRESAAPHFDGILAAIERADVLIAATPVYKASYTGLFKHLFDLLDPKALEGRYCLPRPGHQSVTRSSSSTSCGRCSDSSELPRSRHRSMLSIPISPAAPNGRRR